MLVDNEKFVIFLGDVKFLCKVKLVVFIVVWGEDD